jgi:hypothetical protein
MCSRLSSSSLNSRAVAAKQPSLQSLGVAPLAFCLGCFHRTLWRSLESDGRTTVLAESIVLAREDTRNRACGQIKPERRAEIFRQIFGGTEPGQRNSGSTKLKSISISCRQIRIWLSFIVFSIVSEDFLQVTVPFSVVFLNTNLEK